MEEVVRQQDKDTIDNLNKLRHGDALSRCKCAKNIYLKYKLKAQDVQANKLVNDFMETLYCRVA